MIIETSLLIKLVIFIIALDFFTGVMAAVKEKNLNSTICRNGLFSKSAYFILIILGYIVSMLIQNNLILNFTLIFILGSEGLSILENLARLGIKIPAYLKDILIKVKDAGDKGDDINE